MLVKHILRISFSMRLWKICLGTYASNSYAFTLLNLKLLFRLSPFNFIKIRIFPWEKILLALQDFQLQFTSHFVPLPFQNPQKGDNSLFPQKRSLQMFNWVLNTYLNSYLITFEALKIGMKKRGLTSFHYAETRKKPIKYLPVQNQQ